MSRRTAAACVFVVLLLAAFATAGAAQAAGPVFFSKAPVGSTAPAVSFTDTWGAWFIEAQSGNKLSCNGATGSGEVTGATTVANDHIALSGCETSGVECHNAAANEVVLNTLAGSLGSVSATAPGLRLFSQAEGKGGVLTEYTCAGGAVKVAWRGSVIGSLSGASGKTVEEGKLAGSIRETFSQSAGVQKYVRFLAGEGEAGEEQLEQNTGAGFEKLGISAIATIKTQPFSGELGFTK
ncbi:MAG TPA: hypothetical protein VFW29_03170 [Solirubrobacteraceae bacterium]|nr:hypothetical protein [Solirubrobacteraceae bacterium]